MYTPNSHLMTKEQRVRGHAILRAHTDRLIQEVIAKADAQIVAEKAEPARSEHSA